MCTSTAQRAAPVPPPTIIADLLRGYMKTQLLYAAAHLGVADALGSRPRTAEQIGDLLGVPPQTLARLLRGLVALGLLTQQPDGAFSLTPAGRLLCADGPGSMREEVLLMGELGYRAWSQLLHSLTTGTPAFDATFGMSYFDYLAQHHDRGRTFNEGMARSTQVVAAGLLSVYDFTATRTVIDIGGGRGALIAAILQAYPHLHGILYDRPAVIEHARQHLASVGLLDRCTPLAGDFFQGVPPGGDLYLLSWVIHDWDDALARALLKCCREAMPAHSTLLLIEAVIPETLPEPLPQTLSETIFGDLGMLTMTGGRERTAAEYRDLLAGAGFELARVIPTRTMRSVVEALPRP